MVGDVDVGSAVASNHSLIVFVANRILNSLEYLILIYDRQYIREMAGSSSLFTLKSRALENAEKVDPNANRNE